MTVFNFNCYIYLCIRKKILADQNNDFMNYYCLRCGRNCEGSIQMTEVYEVLLWY